MSSDPTSGMNEPDPLAPRQRRDVPEGRCTSLQDLFDYVRTTDGLNPSDTFIVPKSRDYLIEDADNQGLREYFGIPAEITFEIGP